jgi:serralysin
MPKGNNRPPATRDDYLEALLWLTPHNPFPVNRAGATVITYAFGSAGLYEIRSPDSTVDQLAALAWEARERAALEQALQTWTNVANVRLVEKRDFASDPGTHQPTRDVDFHFLITGEAGMRDYFSGEAGVLGFATLPFDYGPNYDIIAQGYDPGFAAFNRDGDGWTTAGPQAGGFGFATLVHEIGHLFGLDHPFDEGGHFVDGTNRPEPFFPGATSEFRTGTFGLNQGIFTAMSFNDGWTGQPSRSLDWGFQMGPGAFDIAAMQELYGANMAYRTGNDTYTLPQANAPGTGWLCLWDAGGEDTIRVPAGGGAATIDLRDAPLEGPNAGGHVSWIKGIAGGFTIANGAAIENATGGAGNDTLIGNELANMLRGGGGADRLEGGGGRDELHGDGGNDTFAFTSLADFESASGQACVDMIFDFTQGQDRIDFRTFDADIDLAGVQDVNFRFVASFDAGDPDFHAGDRHIGRARLQDERSHPVWRRRQRRPCRFRDFGAEGGVAR